MVELKIVDLPKNTPFLYYPPRPTTIVIRRSHERFVRKQQYSLQRPLILHVGDSVFCESAFPEQMLELTRENTGHPKYATIKKVRLPQTSAEQVSPEQGSPEQIRDVRHPADESASEFIGGRRR